MEQSQETQVTTHKRGGKTITALIAIVAFLVGVGLYALLSATILKPSTTAEDGKKDKPAEKSNVLSYETANNLIRRTNIIVFGRNTSDRIMIGEDPIVTSLSDFSNLNPDFKASAAYMYGGADLEIGTNKWERTTIAESKAVREVLGMSVDEAVENEYFVYHDYDISKVQEAYKKLFGEELDMNAKSYNLTATRGVICITYIPSMKAAFDGICGGGMALLERYTYINNVQLDGNKAYVDFNFISSNYGHGDWNSSYTSAGTLTCYDNFDKKPISNCDIFFDSGITEFTYEYLKNYRVTYEDDGTGNYIYKGVELVK